MANALALLLLTCAGDPGAVPGGAGAHAMAATRLGAARPARDRIRIPAGPFVRGSTRGAEDERPVETVTLSSFVIDRTEVTQAMYARCVTARRCPAVSQDLQREPELPVTGVSWHEARAFCAYAGGRLPTEAEWEKAARGTDGREYPWGDEPDCGRANWGNFEGEGPCAQGDEAGQPRNPGHPVAVGSYPAGASPYGVLDLAGNVWEWVEDRYRADPDPRRAPAAPAESSRRQVRGGSCCSYFVVPRAANRNGWDPRYRDSDLGFRCAWGPPARVRTAARGVPAR
jgi:serine/threonine-protein kinase